MHPSRGTSYPRIARGLVLCAALLLAVGARGESRVQPSLTIYFQSTLKDQAHQQKTFKKVGAAWKPPATSRHPAVGTKTVVRAVIAKGGRLVSTDIWTSSGSKEWDAAVEKAVRAAAPYDPLPASFAYPSYEADFHMSYLARGR
jgi:outer membrane biosynthesis protein TonB